MLGSDDRTKLPAYLLKYGIHAAGAPTTSNVFSSAEDGEVSSMCWYASYSDGRIRADMEPSTTTKFLLPFVFTPVTYAAQQQEVSANTCRS